MVLVVLACIADATQLNLRTRDTLVLALVKNHTFAAIALERAIRRLLRLQSTRPSFGLLLLFLFLLAHTLLEDASLFLQLCERICAPVCAAQGTRDFLIDRHLVLHPVLSTLHVEILSAAKLAVR